MPSKFLLRNFEKGQTYHLRHQGKLGSPLFKDQHDYQSFVLTLSYYLRFPDGAPLSWVPRLSPKALAAKQGKSQHHGQLPVTLRAFLLLPDHFHLILTENTGDDRPGLPAGKAGISELMRRLSVGYAMTYRNKYQGSGTIYQGKYKMTPLSLPEISSLITWLHAHPEINPTFLKDPLHSSLSDYESTPRPWLKPIDFQLSQPATSALDRKLTLE